MTKKAFSSIPNDILSRFGRWFPSAAGVWQTFLGVGLIAGLELAGIVHDDHGFWLLFWLTVYSGVTQPVLGYVNRLDTARADAVLKEMQALMVEIREQENEELKILRARVQELDTTAQEAPK